MTTVDMDTLKHQLTMFDDSIKEIKNHIVECRKKAEELSRSQGLLISKAIMDGDMLKGPLWKVHTNLTEMASTDNRLSFVFAMLERLRYALELCDGIKIHSSSYGDAPGRIEIHASSYRTADLMAFAMKYGLTVDHSAIDYKIDEMQQMIAKPKESK